MDVAVRAGSSKLVAAEGGQIEVFWGACTTTQRGDGRLRSPLGPLTPAGKRQEKTKENEGKWLKTGRKWRNGRKKVGKTKENEGKSLKAGGKRRKMEELRSSTESSVRWGSEQESLQGDEKWYWRRGGEGLQSKENNSKGAADGLGF